MRRTDEIHLFDGMSRNGAKAGRNARGWLTLTEAHENLAVMET